MKLIAQKYVAVKMKALSLPVNVLVIIAIAIIVLLAVIVLFYSGYSSSQKITLDAAKSQGCHALVESNCILGPSTIYIKNFDVDKDGTVNTDKSPMADSDDNLMRLCTDYYMIAATAITDCKKLCNC